ncbi:MAG TPA: hypothetical protein EYP29_04440 [Thermoplasmata archaeon]|nr:hypothetical protein [Thermoplasmata archaeon]
MTKKYRRSSRTRKKPSHTSHQKKVSRESQKREPMLNLRNRISFKYDLEMILKKAGVEEKYINTIVANIISKASQASIKEAKKLIFEIEEKGIISPATGKDIVLLLNRNTRYR